MNIKIHAKAYRSQCSGFNLCFTSFIKQGRTLATIRTRLERGTDTSLYMVTLKVNLGRLVEFEFGLNAVPQTQRLTTTSSKSTERVRKWQKSEKIYWVSMEHFLFFLPLIQVPVYSRVQTYLKWMKLIEGQEHELFCFRIRTTMVALTRPRPCPR